MSAILLSIKPEYSKLIFEGTKKYEFRKHLAQKKVDKIIVYSSSPVQRVIGEVSVIETISMKPSPLWELTKKEAGISRAKFRAYFYKCKEAHAYKLGKSTLYDSPRTLEQYGIKQAPQSFVYLKECPYCKKVIFPYMDSSINSNVKSEEHIIPFSLGNEKLVLPKGIICDGCNNYFAREIEKPFLENKEIRKLRSYHCISSRKKRIPELEVLVNQEKAKISFFPEHNCVFIGLSKETIEKIQKGEITTLISTDIDVNSLIHDYTVSRFLVKVFTEICILFSIQHTKNINDKFFLVCDEKMEELCEYVRFGDRAKKIYNYSVEKVQDTTPFKNDDFVASINITTHSGKLTGMVMRLFELEFVLSI